MREGKKTTKRSRKSRFFFQNLDLVNQDSVLVNGGTHHIPMLGVYSLKRERG